MQFAHSGSETEKQPPPHPALSYDATAGAPHSAESAPSHGVAPRSLQAPHLHHPTAPRSRPSTPLHPCRSMMLGTHRPITPYPRLFATLHLCRSMAPYALSTQGAVPAPHHAAKPHAAHSTALGPSRPSLGTAPELPEVWKQKNDQNCNFFAIGNCHRCPNHGSNPENEAKRPLSALFPLYGRRERAANRKKVAKAPRFLFS